MKKAFIVTSIIDVDNVHPLTYSNTRSIFSDVERFRHTTVTIASLDLASNQDTTIFLVDASENYQQYKDVFRYQENLKFISVKEEFPDVYNIIRTHPNKSYCESLILVNFFTKYKTELENYDYFFKMSGRYFIDHHFNTALFNEENTDKIFFKKPMKFNWSDTWKYTMVDRRSIQGDDYLYQYSSVLYGFGKIFLDRFLDIYRVIAVFTGQSNTMMYDVETLLYYFTRSYESNIIETDWIVYGWDGTNATFLRY